MHETDTPAKVASTDELVLVAKLRECLPTTADGPDHKTWCSVLVSDLRQATEEIDEMDQQRDMLADILRRTAVALRGPEPALTRWSWHDLPERAAQAIAAISLVQAAERERIVNALPGGYSVDPQWVADMVRDGPLCGKPDTSEPVVT